MLGSFNQFAGLRAQRFGLIPRVCAVAGILVIETLAMSYLIQNTPLDLTEGSARLLRVAQYWLFRFVIAYAAAWIMLACLKSAAATARLTDLKPPPVRLRWLAVHLALLAPFAVLCASLYKVPSPLPFAVLAIVWHVCGAAVVLSLLAALAPASLWFRAVRLTAAPPLYAFATAIAAVAAIKLSQFAWVPAARITFLAVEWLLRPFIPTVRGDPETLSLSTPNFSVAVSDRCSGLEGMGLMVAFCLAWLWYARREFVFPRAFLIVPVAAALMFLLNIARIAALIAIGDSGYSQIALVGFHSQAGWIAFNGAAFAVVIVSDRISWLKRAGIERTGVADSTAAYLVPLLAILAAGMIAHALSGAVELLYPLRLLAGGAAIIAFRRTFHWTHWRFELRACGVGALIFCLWAAIGHLLLPAAGMPASLGQLPAPTRDAWIACRVLAAVITVPVAEELAYRGYLMRRLAGARFESIDYSRVKWPAVLVSALAFGIMHGTLWSAGIIAGVAYAMLAVRSGSLRESMLAHATTNALLAGYVLISGQWQFW
jgi:exosortase E/protease (VPEID-CTERM system)